MCELAGRVITAPVGARGFDCIPALTPETARAFKEHKFDYAIRYLRRAQKHTYDLTHEEAEIILAAGLGLMVVQHVASANSWVPTPDKGIDYGTVAVSEAHEIGLPAGTMIWLDLEGVSPGTPKSDIVDYCNNWYEQVKAAGFTPGIYVGWHCGLNSHELYYLLKFEHYWAAYNLNNEEEPDHRGVQMRQHAWKKADAPPGITFQFDSDTIGPDNLGGLPTLLVR